MWQNSTNKNYYKDENKYTILRKYYKNVTIILQINKIDKNIEK